MKITKIKEIHNKTIESAYCYSNEEEETPEHIFELFFDDESTFSFSVKPKLSSEILSFSSKGVEKQRKIK